MIAILFGLTVVVVFIMIIWANNTLKEEYRHKNTIEEETISAAKLNGGKDEKKHTIGGRP